MSFTQTNGSIRNDSPYPDNYYECQPTGQPWPSIASITDAAYPIAYRSPGKSVIVQDGNKVVRYTLDMQLQWVPEGNNAVAVVGRTNEFSPMPKHIGAFLAELGTKIKIVQLHGTSKSNFGVSVIKVTAATIQKKYGRAGLCTNFGAAGGSNETTAGVRKQVYGGIGFRRLVRETTDPDYVQYYYGKRGYFRYSTETTGGKIDIYVNDVYNQTVNCKAAQKYGNIVLVDFPSLGYHKVTFKTPVAGIAYLEAFYSIEKEYGVIIEDWTLGAHGANDYYNAHLRGATNGNMVPIPTENDNGIDSAVNTHPAIRPGLVIWAHFTNDGNIQVYSNAFMHLANFTRTNTIPLTAVSEMIAVPNLDTLGNISDPQKKQMYDLLYQTARDYDNVSFVDYANMANRSDMVSYAARYFTPQDQTHESNFSQMVGQQAALNMFGLSHSGNPFSDRIAADTELVAASRSPFMEGYGTQEQVFYTKSTDFLGRMKSIGKIGIAVEPHTSQQRPLFFDASARNQIVAGNQTNATIASNPDGIHPYHGNYLDGINANFKILKDDSKAEADTEVTIVLLIQRTGSIQGENSRPIRFFNDGQALPPRIFINNTKHTDTSVLVLNSFEQEAPVFFTVNVRPNEAGDTSVNFRLQVLTGLRVYGVWAVNGSLPVIPGIEDEQARNIGSALILNANLLPGQIKVGGTYIRKGSDYTNELVALDGYTRHITVVGNTFTVQNRPLYRLMNKTSHFRRLIAIQNGLVYAARIGGELSANSGGDGVVGEAIINANYTPNATYTLTLETFEAEPMGLKIFFDYNGRLYLQKDGTWSNNEVDVFFGFNQPGNISFSFNMPTVAQMAGLPDGCYFLIRIGGNITKFTTLALGKGPDAVI